MQSSSSSSTTTATGTPRRRRQPLRHLPCILQLLLLLAVAAVAASGPADMTLITTLQHRPPLPSISGSSEGYYDVLVVPHSHCDAGYKKTVEGYYLTEVRRVLDSVVAALSGDESLRFAWAEAAYLWRWWQDALPSQREAFHALVRSGRMELMNGGWVMHDEAIAGYESQVHQMRTGHDLLRSLGFSEQELPRVGWQIDPFGPSAWSPRFMQLAGCTAWVTNRIPDPLKAALRANQSLEFYWATTEDDDEGVGKGGMLTHVLDTHYESPAGFDWEPPAQAGKAIPVTDENVGARAEAFMEAVGNKSQWYRYPCLLVPLGGDFEFQNASVNFGNMTRLMAYINSDPTRYTALSTRFLGGRTPRLRYATPSDYFDCLRAAMDQNQGQNHPTAAPFTDGGGGDTNDSLPTIHGSPFLPLVTVRDDGGGDGPGGRNAWSGYYFGYPNLKEGMRRADSLMRTTEAFAALAATRQAPAASPSTPTTLDKQASAAAAVAADVTAAVSDSVAAARREVDLMPHHDNLPATGYALNNADLAARLARAEATLHSALAQAVGALMEGDAGESSRGRRRDSAPLGLTADLTALRTLEDGQAPVPLVLVNSLGWARDGELVEVVVSRADVRVTDASGWAVMSQVTPIPDSGEEGTFSLAFSASVPALGWATYYVGVCRLTHWTDYQDPLPDCAASAAPIPHDALLADGLQGQHHHLTFNPTACAPAEVATSQGAPVVPLDMSFNVYTAPGDSVYFFAPNTSTLQPYVSGAGEGASVCRLQGYAGPVLQVAYGEVTGAGGDASTRRLAWAAALVNSTTTTSSIRFEVRALAAPAPFEDVTMGLAVPPAAFAGGAPVFEVAENGVVAVARPSSPFGAAATLGESFYPFVSRASLLASPRDAGDRARGRGRGRPPSLLRGRQGVGEGDGGGSLGAVHLVGHAPHAVASLAPGRVEVALHRRVPYDRTHNLRGDDPATAHLSPFHLLLEPFSPTTTTAAAATATRLATTLQAPLVPLTLPSSWPAANASSTRPLPAPQWSALGADAALPPHIHLLSLGEPAFPLQSPSDGAHRVVMLQLQHLMPKREGGAPTALTLDLGRLLLLPPSGGGSRHGATAAAAAVVESVEARSITGAFALGDGGGCGPVEWERGVVGGYVRLTLPPGGFCTLEVVVGSGQGMDVVSPFAH